MINYIQIIFLSQSFFLKNKNNKAKLTNIQINEYRRFIISQHVKIARNFFYTTL
jgi:hypothetical protein